MNIRPPVNVLFTAMTVYLKLLCDIASVFDTERFTYTLYTQHCLHFHSTGRTHNLRGYVAYVANIIVIDLQK